jgi:hypothetical protein
MEHSPPWEANLTRSLTRREFALFCEAWVSLLRSQVHTIHPYPVPGVIPVHGSPLHDLKIHFSNILPSVPRFPSGLFPSGLTKNPVCTSLVSYTRHMPHHVNNILWGVHIIKLSCYLIPPRPQYPPQYHVPEHPPSAYVPPSMWETKFHTHTTQQAKL